VEYHYEYSTYNSHHKVLVNFHASNMDAFKSKSCAPFNQILFLRLLQDGSGSCLHFLHSFNSCYYHHSTVEIILQFARLSVSISLQTNLITVNRKLTRHFWYWSQIHTKASRSFSAMTMIMVALCNRADHYIFIPLLLLSSSSFFLLFFLA